MSSSKRDGWIRDRELPLAAILKVPKVRTFRGIGETAIPVSTISRLCVRFSPFRAVLHSQMINRKH